MKDAKQKLAVGVANQVFRSQQARSRSSLMKKLNTIKSAEEYGETTNERAAESLKMLSKLGSHISAQMSKSKKSASKESSKRLRRKKSKSKK